MTIDELERHIFMPYPPGSAQRKWIEVIDKAYKTGYDDARSVRQWNDSDD